MSPLLQENLKLERCGEGISGLEIFEVTLPETKGEFTPENGWLEDDPFLLGWLIFRCYVSFREGIPQNCRTSEKDTLVDVASWLWSIRTTPG